MRNGTVITLGVILIGNLVHSFVIPSSNYHDSSNNGWVASKQNRQNNNIGNVELDSFSYQIEKKDDIWKLFSSSLESGTNTNTSNRNYGNRNNGNRNNNRNYNGNNNRRFENRRGPSEFQRRNPGGFRPETSLLLANPLKLKRITPPRQQQDDRRGGGRDDRRNNRPRNDERRNVNDRSSGTATRPKVEAKKFTGGGGGDSATSFGDKGPRKTFGQKDKGKKFGAKGNYEERKQRISLRVAVSNKRNSGGGRRRGSLKKKNRAAEKEARMERAMERKRIVLPDVPQTVGQLSEILDEKPTALIKYLMVDLGVMASITQTLDVNTCAAVAQGFGRIVAGSDEDVDEYDDDEEDEEDENSALSLGIAMDEDDIEDLQPRAPVVTIMGHVDHGKTSLLDTLRNTQVVKGEAGGITQHIAAYQIQHEGSPITFIDTPGHAAFTDMRERGANITDIVVLVVAADDGVKQQTADSIVCARQAGVPLVVAINKCDLETADPQRCKTDLAAYDILVEDLGGDIQCAEISAKQNLNIDDLLSKIMLQAELQDLKANPDRNAQGQIIEAKVEKGLGSVATTLIQRGTLKIGDTFVAGETYGKVRALFINEGSTKVDEVGPSTPVAIVGFSDGCPNAGDLFVVSDDEQTARELAESRQRIGRERASSSYQTGLMQSVAAAFTGEKQKQVKEMCVVVKADVQGAAEALARSLSELTLEDDEAVVNIKVLVSEAGDVSKSDIAIASVTPGTTVIAFNCAANYAAMEDARILNIPIEYYSVVYDAIESVESRMQEILSPTPEGEYVGKAIVQEVFNIGGLGNIAGSKCEDGFIKKGSNVRVMRGDKILCESKVKSLRNFKAEVDQIDVGDECGVGLVGFEDFQPGDYIESYVVKK